MAPKRRKTRKHRTVAPSHAAGAAAPARSTPAPRRRAVLLALGLAIATAIAYGPVRQFDFIDLDDPGYVFDNPHVAAGLTADGIAWAFTTGHAANWHPLTWISHMADVALFGLDPGAHHVVNLVFHVVNTLLLFGVLRMADRRVCARRRSWRRCSASIRSTSNPSPGLPNARTC